MTASGPSSWVARFAALVPPGGPVLDVACGAGRHARFFLAREHPVTAIDRDTSGLGDLRGEPGLEIVEFDLEAGAPFPFHGRAFDAVVATNYLHRRGHERLGRPQRPEFLLEPGELLEAVRGALRVVAYEDVILDEPPRAMQRIAAVRAPERVPHLA